MFADSMQASGELSTWLRTDRAFSTGSFRNFGGPQLGRESRQLDSMRGPDPWMQTDNSFGFPSNGWNQLVPPYERQHTTLIIITFVDTPPKPPLGLNSGNPNPKPTGGTSFAGLSPLFDPLKYLSNDGRKNVKAQGADNGDTLARSLNLGSLPLSYATANIPTAAQILSRSVDSVAFITSGAVGSVFQSYSAQLLVLTTSTNAADHLQSLVGDGILHVDEGTSEYLTLKSDLLTDSVSKSDDVVERERQAVDAVLSELHDFSASPIEPLGDLPGADLTANALGKIELNTAQIWSAALADAEGGMVMLANTGDANQSAFDLATVADGSAELLHVHAGVEAAVGLYQTMDLATDEAPLVILPNAKPATESNPETSGENRYSNERETETSGKAAAAVGATLAGALLWASRKAHAKDARDKDSAS